MRSHSMQTRSRQQGVTLLISLIVLVIMTLSGIQLMRSVDTANIIAGNLSFQQAATHSGDSGIEAATSWLEQQNATPSNLYNDQNGNGATPCLGYTSNFVASVEPPFGGATWDTWWTANATGCKGVILPPDAAGNIVSYAIHRMCSSANASPSPSTTQFCNVSPIIITGVGSNNSGQGAGSPPPNPPAQHYYRITSRISGPRGTKSYVQSILAI